MCNSVFNPLAPGIHHLLLTVIKVMTQSGRMLKRERRGWYHSCIAYVISGRDYLPAVKGWGGMEEAARKKHGATKRQVKKKMPRRMNSSAPGER